MHSTGPIDIWARRGMRVGSIARRGWGLMDEALKGLMAALLFSMMIITAADVFGRYVLNSPVPGGYEIVQYLMAIVVFASLPLTTAAERHLTVSLISDQLPQKVRRSHRIFVLLLSSVGLIVIAWRMVEQASILARSQQISGFLQIPLAPIAYAMAGFALLAAAIIVLKLVVSMFGLERNGSLEPAVEEEDG
jgi:TRAP-type transport system small permease protein